jgi:hypothetical protein
MELLEAALAMFYLKITIAVIQIILIAIEVLQMILIFQIKKLTL